MVRGTAVVLATLALLAPPRILLAADQPDFRAYTLRNAPATEMESALGRLLPAGTEILVDAKANRILVRGPESTQQVVARVLASLDRPNATPATAGPAVNEPLLKSYPARSGDSVAAAAWLRGQFANPNEVRIAADPRTAQVLVLATPQVHAQVAERLEQLAAGQGPAAAAPAAAVTPSNPGAPSAKTTSLRSNTAMQVEAALVRALGTRLMPSRTSTPGTSCYTMAIPGQRPLDVSIHYQSGQVSVQGTGPAVESLVKLVAALDAPKTDGQQSMQLVSLKTSKPADVQKAVAAIQAGGAGANVSRPAQQLAMMFQPQPAAEKEKEQPAAKPGDAAAKQRQQTAEKLSDVAGLIAPVQIEMLDGLDVLVIRGHDRDVQQVMQIIQQIEALSQETQPSIEMYAMQNVDCEAMALLATQLYNEVYSLRQGTVTIMPLVKPNSLLLIGRPENVRTATDLIKKLDQPVAPDTQFRVFALKYATAQQAQMTLMEFFTNRPGLGTRVRVTADVRTNSLVLQASARDIAEVSELIAKIDVPKSEAVNEVRIIKLENSLASEVAGILMSAITGQMQQQQRTGVGGLFGGIQQQPTTQPGARTGQDQKSVALKFLTVDPKGKRLLDSGILADVRVNADARNNSLIISAPSESMELLEALIKELDSRPAATAVIKVFTIVNGDALSLAEMLQSLFGQTQQGGVGQGGAQGGGFGGFGGPLAMLAMAQSGAGDGESTLIPLRLAVDVRTNSIIASGAHGDLSVVEALLLRLDEGDVRNRKSVVYRLKNAPAQNVAQSINDFLRSEKQLQTISPGLISAFEQIEREVVVVAEIVSNSLIVSATPRYFEEVKALVEQLDKRPPMVLIQVLIAEVDLDNFDEFGVEMGLQDSILFDRSVLGNIQNFPTTTTTTTGQGQSTITVQQTQNNFASATNAPGFQFNNQPPGNSGGQNALASAGQAAGQALSHFSVGRTNNELGYGGMVLSASSESVSVLIRALRQNKRLDVLSRPQVMTLDNQPAFILVGQRVPRITNSTLNTTGAVNNTTQLENVGLMLNVTPRISPDGLVVMQIDAEKSQVGPEAEGIPISIQPNGQTIRSPRFDTTQAQTTVSAMNGQTVILGGLITKNKSKLSRRVPLLSDIPVIGPLLFSYDSNSTTRTELLIIMTPHIVESEGDAETIKQTEAARMSWCLADVDRLHGDVGLRKRGDDWSDSETKVIYPDGEKKTPGAKTPEMKVQEAETIAAPAGSPSGKNKNANDKPGTKSPLSVPLPPQPDPIPAPLPTPPPPKTSGGPTPYPSAQDWQYQQYQPAPAGPVQGVMPAAYQTTPY